MQTGDYMDRGEQTRAVLDLLMALETQAATAGGRATSLLGNHEVMNLIGENRDVTREIYATFADANSEKRRAQAWDDYAALAKRKQQKGEPVPTVYAQTREAWLTTHPLGFAEYKEALSPKGKYGQWLRGKSMVTTVDGSIFMHAGIAPDQAPARLDDLNGQLKDEIRKMDRFVDDLIDEKLATREFTLQEILQVASNEIGLANARMAAAKARVEASGFCRTSIRQRPSSATKRRRRSGSSSDIPGTCRRERIWTVCDRRTRPANIESSSASTRAALGGWASADRKSTRLNSSH